MVLLSKTIGYIKDDIAGLFFITTYFQYNGDIYQQKDGVATDSFSSIVANYNMEKFEQKAPHIWH